MNIIEKKLNEIRAYEKNPRKIDTAVEAVANSIKEFGFKVPIIIDKDGVIVCGHTRMKAAKKLGMQTVPCIIADDLTDEQIKAFRLADNKVSELAEWDFDLLDDELEEIANIDMNQFGFEKTTDAEDVIEDEYDPTDELLEEAKTKQGEMYKLGEHYLLVGDSTNEADVERLMQGEKADLVVTDPPYNVDVKNSKGMKIKNDNMGDTQFHDFLRDAFHNLYMSLKCGGGSMFGWLQANG